MAIQVGINGFGRIGRSVFRIISDRENMEDRTGTSLETLCRAMLDNKCDRDR
jgi:homoserine dehydrogenase